MLAIETRDFPLRLTAPLHIAGRADETSDNVFVKLTVANESGFGEAAPHPYYTGETAASVHACLRLFAAVLGDDPFAIQSVMDRLDQLVIGNRSAKAAVDIALHDLVGRLLGVPVYKLLCLDPTRTAELGYTIPLDSVDAMVARAAIAAETYNVLKIKLGSDHDEDIVREVAAAVAVPIRVDVNGAWTAQHALRMVDSVLAPAGVTLLEQPVPPRDLEGLRTVHLHSAIPVIADEAVSDIHSVPSLVGRCAGIDIKLMKCGGMRAALSMISTARAYGMSVMIGCSLESSLGITAGATLTPLADFADLDLHLSLVHDPFRGATVERGRFVLPTRPGLGVEPVDASLAAWAAS
ncbi:MAG: dipeptide epimerase [Candidatus Limnocylindrales bacterium]